jgi:hypothetical protein
MEAVGPADSTGSAYAMGLGSIEEIVMKKRGRVDV